MGIFRQNVSFRNPQTDQSLELEALVDTGSTLTVMSGEQAAELSIEVMGTRSFELANKHVVDLAVGYVDVGVAGRSVITLCAFGEEVAEPILGATTLELLFLTVDPVRRTLVPVPGLLM